MPGKLLVIYSIVSTVVATTMEYVRSFGRYSQYEVSYVNGTHGARLGVELDEFDAIWLNYCCRLCFPGYVGADVRQALKTYRGLKLVSVQDEYEQTENLRQAIEELEFDVVFSVVPESARDYVYPKERFPRTEFISVLTGYVPEQLEAKCATTPLERRPITIGYRGRDLGARYGELGFWKAEIGRRVRAICLERHIPCDIEVSEASRIAGNRWYTFIESCRTMLGTESGSNVFDFDGSIQRRDETLKRTHGPLAHVAHGEFASYVAEHESNVGMGQISPRVFEAAALRTPQILLTGRYSGLIEPDEHYLELKKDFSNLDDVLRQVEDIPALHAMAQRTYDRLIASGAYSYRRFVELVDSVIARKLSARAERQSAPTIARPTTGSRADHHLLVTDLPSPEPLDSSHLAGERVRRLLARLPDWWPLMPERLTQDPAIVGKALVSIRAISVHPLRGLFLAWLADAKSRRGIGYDQLLTDLFKLEIVRQARRGILQAREPFFIACRFDSATGELTLTSVPARGASVEDNGREVISELAVALSEGRLSSILWDHSALGWQVVWEPRRAQRLTVFVGTLGEHRFDALAELARSRPDRVASVLMGILAAGATRPARVS
jgi:hypothetical protein